MQRDQTEPRARMVTTQNAQLAHEEMAVRILAALTGAMLEHRKSNGVDKQELQGVSTYTSVHACTYVRKASDG